MLRSTLAACLALLTFPPAGMAQTHRMPLPPHVQIVAAPCPGDSQFEPDCSLPDGLIYISPSEVPAARPWVLAHELGHVFNEQVMTAGDRNWFLRRLAPGATRWGTTLDERFADLYADCDTGGRRHFGAFDGGDGKLQFSYARMARLCHAIQRAGARS